MITRSPVTFSPFGYLDARYFERNVAVVQVLLDPQPSRTDLQQRAILTSTFIWGMAIVLILIGRSAFIAWPVSAVSSTCRVMQQKHRHSKRMPIA
jgi:hypothetical protein